MGTTREPATLDLRRSSPAERPQAVREAFDALPPGEALVLLSHDHPRSVLVDLQSQRKGLFEWSPLGQEHQTWSVELVRRAATAGDLRTLTEALAWDHDRLQGLESRCFEALAAGDHETAQRLFRAFDHGMARHLRFEEELLFPVFEAKTGLPQVGPTAVLRAEHAEIQRLVSSLDERLQAAARTPPEQHGELRSVLQKHHRKEEAILYPTTDRLLTAAESDALVARLQSFGS